MAKITWDDAGKREFETGVNHGVLYPFNSTTSKYDKGVAWNGLTGVTESPSGAEPNDLYADNIKYVSLRSAEDFGATIEAFTYPDEFAVLDGSAEIAQGVMIGQQNRGTFGLSYRTEKGNDTLGTDFGYKLHLIYGATASPSEKGYATINDSPDAITFSWEVNTTPVNVAGFKPTAILTIDSTKTTAAVMAAIEDILYGSASTEASLPLPDEIVQIINSNGSTESYIAVENPTGDPSTSGYYELVDGNYVASTDTSVESGKTYYEKING